MITKTRCLVVVATKWVAEQLENFEAMERIRSVSEIEGVFKENKTPYILGDVESFTELPVPVLEYSEELLNPTDFTELGRKNGFETGEYIEPGTRVDTRNESCILCKICNHYGYNYLSTSIYNQLSEVPECDLIIYESKNFVVIPEYGQLKSGLLMIVPKEHKYLSMAMIPEELYEEYDEVRHDTSIMLKGAFGSDLPVIYWEHGSSPSGFSSHKKSIVHAHTHVLVGFKIDRKYLDMVQMHPSIDISAMQKTHYFSYREEWDGNVLACYDDSVYVQRQYPRQIIADSLGYAPGQFNWRNYGFEENIHTTAYKLYEYLSSKNVPQRIVDRSTAFVEAYKERFITKLEE